MKNFSTSDCEIYAKVEGSVEALPRTRQPASSQFEFNCKTLNHKSNIDKRPVSVFSHFKHLVKNESQETKIEKNPLETTHKVNKGTQFLKSKS